jgi:hypothetical protein
MTRCQTLVLLSFAVVTVPATGAPAKTQLTLSGDFWSCQKAGGVAGFVQVKTDPEPCVKAVAPAN